MGEQLTTSSTDSEPPRYCQKCNYNLRGLTTPRCPECGQPFDPADPKTYRARPRHASLRRIKHAAYTFAALVLILAAVWGWFFWGWYSEQQALRALKVDPRSSAHVGYTTILASWPTEHLRPLGFVLYRAALIDLRGRSDLTDLAPLARLTNLQTLFLDRSGVTGLGPLAGLTNLEGLDLSGTGVTDLTPLAGLSNLRWVMINDTGVTDLAPVARLTNLQWLALSGTRVTDLAPLARITKLQRLELSGTRVADLAPLARLKALRDLTVPKATITEAQVDALRRDLPDCTIYRR